MQASQSNNAANSFKSDQRPEPTASGGIPSPLTAPLQAAKEYLDSQRGDSWQVDTRKTGPGQTVSVLRGDEQSRQEQDRRLERSLYEGHSIEAGLNFEVPGAGESLDPDELERAHLVDSDGSEPLFPYTAPGPVPDPEVVRGVILRLARDSESRRDTARNSRLDLELAADTEAAGMKLEASSHGQPLAFGDVARLVWGARSIGQSAPEEIAPMQQMGAPPLAEILTTSENDAHGLRGSGLHLQRADGPTAVRNETQNREAEAAIGSPKAARALLCNVDDEPALAHDARNLLSALRLYGELLASKGVLGEQYRHYAEELQLIAGRSQVLIDRLFQVAAAHGRPATLSAGQPAPSVAPVAGVVASEACGGDVQPTSLVDLLMRWGSLLSTLAHGTLEVVFGPHAATPVPAGAEALERILVNLVRNARAATVAGGAIRICVGVDEAEESIESEEPAAPLTGQRAAACPKRAMVLTVDDSGCGMTEARVRQLLGNEAELATETVPVYEAKQETASDGYGCWPGNGRYVRETVAEIETCAATEAGARSHDRRQGLGLKIVRELVTASGGALSIQSRPDRGTRIEIRWPVTASIADGRPNEATALHPVPSKQPETSPAIEIAIETAIQAGMACVTAIRPAAGIVPPREELAANPATAGPDGFSEAELRAMMLRLHRAGPHERTSPGNRLTERHPYDARPSNPGQGDVAAADGGVGGRTPGAHNAGINATVIRNSSVKGAIAC